MKKILYTALAAAMLFSSCGNKTQQEEAAIEVTPIMEKALNDNTSKFYANFPAFPAQQSKYEYTRNVVALRFKSNTLLYIRK